MKKAMATGFHRKRKMEKNYRASDFDSWNVLAQIFSWDKFYFSERAVKIYIIMHAVPKRMYIFIRKYWYNKYFLSQKNCRRQHWC